MPEQVTSQLLLDLELTPDATLANFLGEVPAALMADIPRVYLWGAVGTGRSHLVQAICHKWYGGNRRVMYLPNPMHASPAILDNLEQFELVCIDDADDVLQSEDWQTPLFHFFNGLSDNGHGLLLTGQSHPLDMAVSLADLRSRFRAMSHVQTSELTDQGKRDLLQQRASRHGFKLSDQVVAYVMSHCARDQRSLLRLLDGLAQESLRQHRKVTIHLVRELMRS